MGITSLNLFVIICLLGSLSWGWGAKGHYVICEAAIHLVKNPELKKNLLYKTHYLGHLCNIPDIYWRNIPNTESGNSAHYIEPDLVGGQLEDSPTSYVEFTKKYQGKNSVLKNTPVFSVDKEIGHIWWRADQFVRLATEAGKKAKSLSLPGKKDEKSDDHPYNVALYQLLTNMGLLGHFVGDAAQPLHNTSNYDGWSNGHGGIHGFFEETIVVNLRPNLLEKIINTASKAKKDLDLNEKSSVTEKMRRHSVLAKNDLDTIWKLDTLNTPSTVNEEKGMSLKKSAKRPDPSKTAEKFSSLIVKEMARAAVLLAYFWDQIYSQAGEPDLDVYKGYRFPLQPDFIEPDYLNTKSNN